LPRQSFEANDRVVHRPLEWREPGFEAADAAGITLRLNLTQQDGCRNPMWPGRFDARLQVVLERIELFRARCPLRITRRASLATQVFADGVA